MLFNSLTFIIFIAIVMGVFSLPLPWTFRKSFLLVASCLFYAAWSPVFVLLLWLLTIVDWLVAARLFRELERQNFPRQQYWERLLEATGCRGIHFEDDLELVQFDCPEWSHLSQYDARLFTRRLYKLLHHP